MDPAAQTILWWSCLVWEEEAWLSARGLEQVAPADHVRGVWPMPSFLCDIGK
jgi:hypothetical protein